MLGLVPTPKFGPTGGLSPTLSVVTTLDVEHMDYYQTMQNMKSAFLEFLNKVPFYGSAIICMDDPNLQSLLPEMEKRTITYGLKTQADYTAREISVNGLKTNFTIPAQYGDYSKNTMDETYTTFDSTNITMDTV